MDQQSRLRITVSLIDFPAAASRALDIAAICISLRPAAVLTQTVSQLTVSVTAAVKQRRCAVCVASTCAKCPWDTSQLLLVANQAAAHQKLSCTCLGITRVCSVKQIFQTLSLPQAMHDHAGSETDSTMVRQGAHGVHR